MRQAPGDLSNRLKGNIFSKNPCFHKAQFLSKSEMSEGNRVGIGHLGISL